MHKFEGWGHARAVLKGNVASNIQAMPRGGDQHENDSRSKPVFLSEEDKPVFSQMLGRFVNLSKVNKSLNRMNPQDPIAWEGKNRSEGFIWGELPGSIHLTFIEKCSHAAIFLMDDREDDDLLTKLRVGNERGRHPIWPLTIHRHRPSKFDVRTFAESLGDHLRATVPADYDCLFEMLLENHQKSSTPGIRHRAPLIVSMPWVDGDRRLLKLLPLLQKNNIFAMVRVLPLVEGEGDIEGRRMLLERCHMWATCPGATVDTGEDETRFINEGSQTLYRMSP